MELEVPSRSNFLHAPPGHNLLRKRRRSWLGWGVILVLLGLVSLLLSIPLAPECPDQTPRVTTSGETCSYGWAWKDFRCDGYCCSPDTYHTGDWCLPSLAYENLLPCDAPVSSWEVLVLHLGPVSCGVAEYLGVVLLFVYARACCNSTAAERKVLTRQVFYTLIYFFILFMGCVMVVYTDCHSTFRGLADILLALSILCFFLGTIGLLCALSLRPAELQMDELLSSVAASGEANVLVLEVGEECQRNFLEAELKEDQEVPSIQVTQNCQCLTVLGFVWLLAAPILLCLVPITSRMRFFTLVPLAMIDVMIIYCYAQRSPRFQRWSRRRHAARQLQTLKPETLVLYSNPRADALAEGETLPQGDVRYMSAAIFGETQLFLPHETQGRLIWTSSTRSSVGERDGFWQIRLLTSCRKSTETLMQNIDMRVEVPTLIPVERHDVPRVRCWLASREIFHFEPVQAAQ